MVLPCLMSAFNSIGGSCFGWIGERISTEAAYLVAYAKNIENLKKQDKNLSDTIESVKNRIEDASNHGATLVDPVVKTLLERMTSVKEESCKLIRDEEQSADSTCLMGLRPNLLACYLTSKSAKKVTDEATELLEEEKKYDRPVANVDYSICLGVTPNPHFEELESRVLASHQIVEALKDPNVHKVGVYGMGGTGKTTLAIKIGADLQLNGTFSYVVLATVSEKQSLLQSNYKSDLTSIQKQIAEGLKIQLEGETLNARATQLRDQLQKRNKLLIILDDIWSKFELEMVGIPVDSKFTSKFKILMTSRSKVVLENEMDSKKNFGLDSLSTQDAQNLFDKMIGGDAQYSNWPLIAREVVDLCGGIPILLVTIGKTLQNATQSIWKDALIQLKRFDGEDIDEEGYKKIEVSYNFLKNEELKKLFLLCAQLNHRSIRFEELLRYAMGLDLFKGRETIKEASGRLHKYLYDLKGCCLLQDGNNEGITKMHDVVHKFASGAPGVFSVANDSKLQRWPSKEQFEKYRAISFFYCGLPSDHELPVAFVNPNIELFLMLRSEIDASFQIPDNFFQGMKGLKVMNLTAMSLSLVLVSSLSALKKLRTLCLDHCRLSDITMIGELPMLQDLSLVGSSIVFFPKEMGQLDGSLKLLDLRDCYNLESIASGVISKLTLLEDLRIGDSFNTWQRIESSDNDDVTYEGGVASLEEFKNLQNLINLEIHVPEHAKMFPKDLVFTKLETFKMFFGKFQASRSDSISTRILEVSESSTSVDFDSEGTKTLMTRAESLKLEKVSSFVSVIEMDPKGFPELKQLKVEKGDGIQYIAKKNYNHCIFPKLETLDLYKVVKLERICDDHLLPVGSFENLRVISALQCHLLNHLLSSNLAKCLLRLKELNVYECDGMENIIFSRERGTEDEEEIQIGFTHQLHVLNLDRLPLLVSFYNFKNIEGIPSPTPLFNKKIMFPKLEELKLCQMKIEKIWDVDHLAEGTTGWFQNLTSLEVCGCNNLRYLFTSSMVKSLAQLKQLEVRYCDSIEEIVVLTERATTGDIQLSFPKLDNIELEDLPKLKRFCEANLLECQLLRQLAIHSCSELKTFVSANDSSSSDSSIILLTEKVAFPNMERLYITDCDSLEKLFHIPVLSMNECRSLHFKNLRSVFVSECPSLTSILPAACLVPKSLQQLERLEVRNCVKIELFGFNNTQQLSDAFAKLISSLDYCHIINEGGLELKKDNQSVTVEIAGCGLQVPPILFALFKSFPKLDKVEVSSYSITQLFPSEPDHLAVADGDDMDTEAKTLAHIGHLKVTKLSNLKHIWSAHSPLKYHVIPQLLEVEECNSLLSLAPPSPTLFKNLTTLIVWRCPMLVKLIASSSTARSLVNLKMLSVVRCGYLEEIVGIDDQWDELANNDECIVFDNLEDLHLEDMNSLTSFCSTGLNRVFVINCPKMKFFSMGALSTPNLIRVWPFWIRVEYEEMKKMFARWEGDLNSTVRKLFEEMENEEEEEEDDAYSD